MLKKSFLEKIKKSLLIQKADLQSKSYNDDIDIEGDETDFIQGAIIATVNSQLSSRDREKILQIDNALLKMTQNLFGYCEECEEPIAEKRLEINPYFSTCIVCAEQKEFEDRQTRKR